MKATKKEIYDHIRANIDRDDIDLALELDVEPEVISKARAEIKEADKVTTKSKPEPEAKAEPKPKAEVKTQTDGKVEPKFYIRNELGIVLELVRKNSSQNVMLFELKPVEQDAGVPG